MLKRKLILFLAVAMTGIFAGSSYFMPNVLAVGESETQPSGDEETVPMETCGEKCSGNYA